MLNMRLLRAKMVLAGYTTRSFADALGWSMSTAYRKINGLIAFTAREIQLCRDLLGLSIEEVEQIFFAVELS